MNRPGGSLRRKRFTCVEATPRGSTSSAFALYFCSQQLDFIDNQLSLLTMQKSGLKSSKKKKQDEEWSDSEESEEEIPIHHGTTEGDSKLYPRSSVPFALMFLLRSR